MTVVPAFVERGVTVYHSDCFAALAALPDQSIDVVITDPPYGLEFMGKQWDTFRIDDQQVHGYNGREAGAHGGFTAERSVMFAGPVKGTSYGGGKRATTSRCQGCGKRDQMRKPHACPDGTNWRTEVIDPYAAPPTALAFGEWVREWGLLLHRVMKPGAHLAAFGSTRMSHRLTCGLENAGFEIRDSLAWMYGQGFPKSRNPQHDDPRCPDGLGTALKPAFEPITLARKPLTETIAATVLEHGTGALNIDPCRITWGSEKPTQDEWNRAGSSGLAGARGRIGQLSRGMKSAYAEGKIAVPDGRWPANVVIDDAAAAVIDADAGEQVSRFFYTAKAGTAERLGSEHPTVKPLELMRWLVRLLTPPGGTVLDPFAGTGTTGQAAIDEGFTATLIEREAEYLPDIRKRLVGWGNTDGTLLG